MSSRALSMHERTCLYGRADSYESLPLSSMETDFSQLKERQHFQGKLCLFSVVLFAFVYYILYILSPDQPIHLPWDQPYPDEGFTLKLESGCSPGTFGALGSNSTENSTVIDEECTGFNNQTGQCLTTQLPWQVYITDDNIHIPYYSNGQLTLMNQRNITYALIVQHGFLRNANQYFCDAYGSLVNVTNKNTGIDPSGWTLNDTIIIAPQFVSPGDICWDRQGGAHVINISEPDTSCELPLWNNNWVIGNASLNTVNSSVHGNDTSIYSFDIFNYILSRLENMNYFPNLKNITFFGFSAGGQSVQRYLIYPRYDVGSKPVPVSYVISDPSAYVYFDEYRVFTNGTDGFGIPDPSWIPSQWAVRLVLVF
jgi:hypothetical protein